jgi:hypothetical protein
MSPSSDSAATSASRPLTIARACAPEATYDVWNTTSRPVFSFQYLRNAGINCSSYASFGTVYAARTIVSVPSPAPLRQPALPPATTITTASNPIRITIVQFPSAAAVPPPAAGFASRKASRP